MAIQNNKYNNSFIYTVRSPHTDRFYIGSTTQSLCRRFVNHKSKYNSYINNGIGNYITSYNIIELGDSYIELLEEINCDSKTQLEKREGELIRLHKDLCVNKIIAGRTDKQYKFDNIDKIKQDNQQYYLDNADKIKQYYIENTDRIKQYNKQYHFDNTDKAKQYYLDNADKIKQYHIVNSEKINQRKKQYRLDNADRIKQSNKQYYLDNADKIKQYHIDNSEKINQRKKQYRLDNKQKYQNKKTPKINITKDDYDFLVYCDKLMNLQYSYKKFIIVE